MKKRLPDGINRFSCQVQQDNSEASGGASAQEIEANVQAIAALPDLLDALERLLACPDLQFDAMEPESREAMADAKAALTKAGYTF